jgi:hypothetical protein
MATRRYLNFDLLVEQDQPGLFQARVTSSPTSETPRVRFALPFDATTLELLLLRLDPGRSGMRRVGRTVHEQAAMDFGGPLYEAVFADDVASCWARSQEEAERQDVGLRLRLRLNDAGGISGLPWELLYDARNDSFVAQSERTPLVRFLDLPRKPRPITVDGPLRVLAMISSPIDLEEIDTEAEWRRLSDALADQIDAGLVMLERLPSATFADLSTWVRRHSVNVIHFVGHGEFDDHLGEGVVYLQDRRGARVPINSSTLGPVIRDHDPLRMIVLNACRSARTTTVDPFAGLAQGLVQQDATAVVAMQFPISDRAAVCFTEQFYGALADGLPVDQAMGNVRKLLRADFPDEWATPVLFLRAPDGDIFQNIRTLEREASPGLAPPGRPPATTYGAVGRDADRRPLDNIHEPRSRTEGHRHGVRWVPFAAGIALLVGLTVIAIWLLHRGAGTIADADRDELLRGIPTSIQQACDPMAADDEGLPTVVCRGGRVSFTLVPSEESAIEEIGDATSDDQCRSSVDVGEFEVTSYASNGHAGTLRCTKPTAGSYTFVWHDDTTPRVIGRYTLQANFETVRDLWLDLINAG